MIKQPLVLVLVIAFWIFVGQATVSYFANQNATKPMVVKVSQCGKTVLLISHKRSTHVSGIPVSMLHEQYIIQKTIGDKGKLVSIDLDALLGINLCSV